MAKILLEVYAMGSHGQGNNVIFHVKSQDSENKEEAPLLQDISQGSVSIVGIHAQAARYMKRGKLYRLTLEEAVETKEGS